MPPIAPEGVVHAVGDLHGRADLLVGAVEAILSEDPGCAAGAPGPEVVFLGDYIDRGEHVRETLDTLVHVARLREIRPVFLMGNHEAMLLGFLEDPEREARWLRVGGLQTLLSFGIGAYETSSGPELARIREELADAVRPYLPFLSGLALSHRSGNLLFVHAAADPALPPERQPREALLWGHPEFERTPRRDGVWVVHGHRIVDTPRIERGRIAIDTGAYFSGCLTTLTVAPDGSHRFSHPRPAGRAGA
ncbi:metallophosphoesterase family protein [Paralimibaculum aggregatum]|uniref:Metallophosphoesterase family protein n=1 Tax=Paralimibaculum aggregatum TaxID=3036245 RepID=A0ABQ6LKY0_9RHOB|nr:metallophosphoesterase [Limibaculum sp. NKW23]GMG82327.1 metallophosphoesterase family protein [Limibaculum sp. NKW23]